MVDDVHLSKRPGGEELEAELFLEGDGERGCYVCVVGCWGLPQFI